MITIYIIYIVIIIIIYFIIIITIITSLYVMIFGFLTFVWYEKQYRLPAQ